ncbi:MAG: acylneuraminate cytidylyltransferase family protein [Verrucomicrobiota bacterium]
MNTQSSLCFIPARGGSKRVPGKNLLPLGGRSLLRRAVDSAVGAGVFDRVVVSSDDPDVEEAVASWNEVEYHRRNPELANDHARVPEVVHHYLQELPERERPETIGVVLPPCPFRTLSHVREAYERFQKENPAGFLVSVTRYDFPPQFAVRWEEKGAEAVHGLQLVHPEVYAMTTRSQSVEPLWHPNGALYLCGVEAFLQTASFFSHPLIGYEMSAEDSFDIDWPHQFSMAEAMIAAGRQQ